MDARLPGRLGTQDPELIEPAEADRIESWSTAGWSITLRLSRPVPRFRSPIMEHRPFRPMPRDHDRIAMTMPAARDVIRPIGWAMLMAIPVLVVVGWQVATFVGVASAIVRVVDGQIARSNLSFADGFIGFRGEAAWPKGVQEDDDVRWDWSKAGNGQAAHG
jgi:hypothetical protein